MGHLIISLHCSASYSFFHVLEQSNQLDPCLSFVPCHWQWKFPDPHSIQEDTPINAIVVGASWVKGFTFLSLRVDSLLTCWQCYVYLISFWIIHNNVPLSQPNMKNVKKHFSNVLFYTKHTHLIFIQYTHT